MNDLKEAVGCARAWFYRDMVCFDGEDAEIGTGLNFTQRVNLAKFIDRVHDKGYTYGVKHGGEIEKCCAASQKAFPSNSAELSKEDWIESVRRGMIEDLFRHVAKETSSAQGWIMDSKIDSAMKVIDRVIEKLRSQ